jgi:septal ring factor EnvC (AmiA/AmiB activator)
VTKNPLELNQAEGLTSTLSELRQQLKIWDADIAETEERLAGDRESREKVAQAIQRLEAQIAALPTSH